MSGCNCNNQRNTTENMLLLFHKQWFLGFLFFKLLCTYRGTQRAFIYVVTTICVYSIKNQN